MELLRPYTIAYTTHYTIKNIFVEIICSDGTTGLGAGSPSHNVTGEIFQDSYDQEQEQLRELFIGRDIDGFRQLIDIAWSHYQLKPALMAAIDIALHDAFTRSVDIPLAKYFGVNIQPLPTSMTIGIKESYAETLAEAEEFVRNGFKILKLKIGTNYEKDLETYTKLREAISKEILIRVDANQGFSVEQMQDFVHKTQNGPVEFFEQPLPPKQYQEMLKLPEPIRLNCAGDEDVQKLSDAVQLAQDPLCYGIYNIKLMKCGGIAEGIRIADVAATRGIKLMWGCMDESIISITAALLAAMSRSNTRYLDLDGSFDLGRDIVSGGFELRDGIMYPITDLPGLGVTRL